MSEFVDYYEILQVHPKADAEVVAKAYKALIFKYHPDRGGSEDRCKLINEAYEVLGDAARRADYNLEWAAAQVSSRPATPAAPTTTSAGLTVDDLFHGNGWPNVQVIRQAFGEAWSALTEWRALGGGVSSRSGSNEELRLRDEILGLTQVAVRRGGIDEASVMELLERSFPDCSGTVCLDTAMAWLILGGLTEPGVVEFPQNIMSAFTDWRGVNERAEDDFVRSLAFFMYYANKHYPEWSIALAEDGAERFKTQAPIVRRLKVCPYCNRKNPLDKRTCQWCRKEMRCLHPRVASMLAVAGRQFDQAAWTDWANRYGNRDRSANIRGAFGLAAALVAGLAIGSVMDN